MPALDFQNGNSFLVSSPPSIFAQANSKPIEVRIVYAPSQPQISDGSVLSDDTLVKDLVARVGRLETDVSAVRVDVGSIKERLLHLPTQAQLWKAVAVSGGAVIASMLTGALFFAKPWLEGLLAHH